MNIDIKEIETSLKELLNDIDDIDRIAFTYNLNESDIKKYLKLIEIQESIELFQNFLEQQKEIKDNLKELNDLTDEIESLFQDSDKLTKEELIQELDRITRGDY